MDDKVTDPTIKAIKKLFELIELQQKEIIALSKLCDRRDITATAALDKAITCEAHVLELIKLMEDKDV